jgi:hypothetical protein
MYEVVSVQDVDTAVRPGANRNMATFTGTRRPAVQCSTYYGFSSETLPSPESLVFSRGLKSKVPLIMDI